MKLGFSSYTFHQRVATGEMSLTDVIDWVADSEGEHLELAAIYRGADAPIPNEESDPSFVETVRSHAEKRGVPLSNLAVGADLSHEDAAEKTAEIERVKKLVDLAEALGIRTMRHDVVPHGVVPGDDSVVFEQKFPIIVDACRQIAEYAATKGITTSLENHGFFVQSSDRVRRIVHAVDRDNFKTTLDIGNFVCVDEDPTSAVPANLPYAMIVHLKDFYIRPAGFSAPDGWFSSRGGKALRGAIVGEGDIDLPGVIAAIKQSGYDEYVSIEFEGHEDCFVGATRGLANARRLLAA
ncbi:sugar phosphate isomerase/epimerase [Friedmanniella endophytica]|uniref:Sugar phosphate isomerase/epimerase n=1 Tax=Microlunatus kandeliicorticis TaxID=1759536 RepID=A0A7W3IR53_9ACTN|nr:sugar phosphate isomerase/epimerase family protein [Microlunatus kandeliicorticis]MBA8793717.1 sugar phosphate isomerase/epimerase [Microlunatus kandeliicorticis]